MSDGVLPNTGPIGEALSYQDLERGMLVAWRWSDGVREQAEQAGVRPIGRVVSRDDLPAMDVREGDLNIQALDAAWWVIAPRTFIAKGGRVWRHGEAAV